MATTHLPDYPFSPNYAKISEFRYHYIDEGEGEPILMVHGNPTWSYYYRHLISALSTHYRTIAVDHIGCGLSDKPESSAYPFTVEQRVKDLEAFVHAMDFQRPITLVLHDWGGMIGMGMATRLPEMISKIVLLNTAAFTNPHNKQIPWQLSLVRNTPLGPLLVQGLNAFALSATYTCCKRTPMPTKIRKAYISPYNNWKNRLATLRFVQDIPLSPRDKGYDFISEIENRLPLLQDKPIMICWGEKDFVFDHDFLQKWLKIFPSAEVHRFPDCGHYILEDASQDIIPLIQNFLEVKEANFIGHT